MARINQIVVGDAVVEVKTHGVIPGVDDDMTIAELYHLARAYLADARGHRRHGGDLLSDSSAATCLAIVLRIRRRIAERRAPRAAEEIAKLEAELAAADAWLEGRPAAWEETAGYPFAELSAELQDTWRGIWAQDAATRREVIREEIAKIKASPVAFEQGEAMMDALLGSAQ